MKTRSTKSTKYQYRVTAEGEIEKLFGQDVEDVYAKCGKGRAGSIFNVQGENAVILKSSKLSHLEDAVENGFWDHTKLAHNIKAGTTVYVLMNKGTGWKNAIVFTATGKMQQVYLNNQNWSETKCAS